MYVYNFICDRIVVLYFQNYCLLSSFVPVTFVGKVYKSINQSHTITDTYFMECRGISTKVNFDDIWTHKLSWNGKVHCGTAADILPSSYA